MKKSHLKKSHSKSKLSWIIAGLAFFLAGSVYLAIASGTGPLSFFTKTPDINKVVDCKGDDDCIEANAIAKKQGLKGAQYDQAVQQVTQTLKKDNVYVEKMTVNKPNKSKDEDPAEDVPAAQQVVISQPTTPCSADQQLVTTSTGNQCIPTNGDGTVCGVYAYAQNNKCYKIGDEVSGGYKVCDWTIGARPGVTWAFLSTNCPTKTEVKPGVPTNADECSTSKTNPGWWSENEKTCVQVGQPITNSPLIVCGAGQRTDKPQYNYPTASTPEVCSSYTAPIVIPPAPPALSNEELERRQEDCKSSFKKYDVTSGACIDLVKCTPTPLTPGAKSYTTCGADGRIEQKFCNNPAGFDANGNCLANTPSPSPTPFTDPKIPKPVTPSPVTTPGYIDNVGCSQRYQTTCQKADDGKWYPVAPPANTPAATPTNPITNRPATPQEEARTKTYNTYLDCTTKTSGLCKADPNDPKKYVFISYIDPTPPKSAPVQSVAPSPVTTPTNSFVQNANGKLDQLVKNQGECKLTGSTYDSEFNLWRCPSADGSVKPPTVSNEAGFSAQTPGYNPEKCNLFTGACEEGTVCSNRVFGGYCLTTPTSLTPTNPITNNPVTTSPDTPAVTRTNPITNNPVTTSPDAKPSTWSQIKNFVSGIINTEVVTSTTTENKAPGEKVRDAKECQSGKAVIPGNGDTVLTCVDQYTTVNIAAPDDTKPSLWSKLVEYFSLIIADKNITPPQGYLDNPSCETRYQADCTKGSDGMWYPTFSK